MLPDLATILGPGLAPELRGRAAEALQALQAAGGEEAVPGARLRATSGREEVGFSDSEGEQGDTPEEVQFLAKEVKERKKSKKKDFPGRSSGRRKTTKENSEKMNVGRSGRERWRKT